MLMAVRSFSKDCGARYAAGVLLLALLLFTSRKRKSHMKRKRKRKREREREREKAKEAQPPVLRRGLLCRTPTETAYAACTLQGLHLTLAPALLACPVRS